MKLLALNIRQGGGTRIDSICSYLIAQDCDALVISEFRRNTPGDQLIEALRQAGFSHIHHNNTDSKQNTVMLATKQASTLLKIDGCSNEWSLIGISWAGLQLVGTYFPQRKDKAGVFNTLETIASGDLLAIGDFNTGSNVLDSEGAKFHCADQFVNLANVTLTDLWRTHNGELAQEYSWYSNTGNGFRIDHALAGVKATSRCVACYYDHSTRGTFTDHSALIVEFQA
jgi:exodeoxyribonuclease-3